MLPPLSNSSGSRGGRKPAASALQLGTSKTRTPSRLCAALAAVLWVSLQLNNDLGGNIGMSGFDQAILPSWSWKRFSNPGLRQTCSAPVSLCELHLDRVNHSEQVSWAATNSVEGSEIFSPCWLGCTPDPFQTFASGSSACATFASPLLHSKLGFFRRRSLLECTHMFSWMDP